MPPNAFVKKKSLEKTRLKAPAWVFTLEYRLDLAKRLGPFEI
jgi:hypothetical protein